MLFSNFKDWLVERIVSEAAFQFGAHRGKDHTDSSIPTSYLQWAVANVSHSSVTPDFRELMRKEINRRQKGAFNTPQKPAPSPKPKEAPEVAPPSSKPFTNTVWILAKSKNLQSYFHGDDAPSPGDFVVLTRNGADWTLMTRSAKTITIPNNTVKDAVESVKGNKGQPITSNDPEELWAHSETLEDQPVNAPPSKNPEDAAPSVPGRLPPHKMSEYNKKIEETFLNSDKNIVINALAGTGKTTMLKHLASFKKPGEKWLYLVFNKKNQVEATQLDPKTNQRPFPPGVQVLTTHSFLGRVLDHNSKLGRIPRTELHDGKGQSPKMAEILDDPWFDQKAKNDLDIPWKRIWTLKLRTKSLASLGKSFNVNPEHSREAMEALDGLIDKYNIDTTLMSDEELEEAEKRDIEPEDYRDQVVDMAYDVLRRMVPNGSPDRHHNTARDHDDTLWWAAMHADQLEYPHFDVVLADEVQDFNKCQQVMLKKLNEAGARIIAVGDPWQAIYRFRGADNDAFKNVEGIVKNGKQGGVTHMLPINYRSGRHIIDFANQATHMKDLEDDKRLKAGMSHDGSVTQHMMYSDVMDKIHDEWDRNKQFSMPTAILARTNAPLLATAMKLLKNGIPFQIVGREFLDEIMKFIKKITGVGKRATNYPIEQFREQMNAYVEDKTREWKGKVKKQGELEELTTIGEALNGVLGYLEENGWRDPLNQNSSLQIKDAYSFMDFLRQRFGGLNVQESDKDAEQYEKMKDKVVNLTTGHRSKGLEFDRVFIIRNDLYLSPKGDNAEEIQQEKNGQYVAYTRAKKELNIINDKNP